MNSRARIPFNVELEKDFRPPQPPLLDDLERYRIMRNIVYAMAFLAAAAISVMVPTPTFYQSPVTHLVGGAVALAVCWLGLVAAAFLRLVAWVFIPVFYLFWHLLPFGSAQLRWVLFLLTIAFVFARFLHRVLRRHAQKLGVTKAR